MAETQIIKSLVISGNNSLIFNKILNIMTEFGYTVTSKNWPDELELVRGKGGLMATSIKDVKTNLYVKLEQQSDEVRITFNYSLNIPSSFLSKDGNEIDKEFLEIKNKMLMDIDQNLETNKINQISDDTTTPQQQELELNVKENTIVEKSSDIIEKSSEIKSAIEKLREEDNELKNQFALYKKSTNDKDEFLLKLLDEVQSNLKHLEKFFHSLIDEKGVLINQIYVDELNEIRDSSSVLMRIISHLFDIQKIDLGGMILTENNYNLSEIINESILKQMEEADAKGITIKANLREDISSACDKKRLGQVLEDIIFNAIDFSPSSTGEIEIYLTEEEQSAKIIIKDNGIGIKGDPNKIFDKFYQINSNIKRSHQEGGLGMAFCKGIIEGHKGKIWAESEGVGSGTELHILLPLVTEIHETIRKVD